MGLLEEVSAGWGLPACEKLTGSHPALFFVGGGAIAAIPLIFIRWGLLRAAAWLLESKDNSGVL